ncbi:hypothetical protein [Mangrovimonas futianensis]|uniref:hypothetical protein n=1 Tax=Mangrovimonas futianensis TaxID=2895523 RepID=UPI001E2B208E|nr:hypothetical protein [Mangrovimonas futianensis]MCF1421084.1 hypothetical protein [Mangrovimonas futianensis]
MKFVATIIVLFLVLTACQNEKKQSSEDIEGSKNLVFSDLVLHDRFDNTLVLDTLLLGREAQFSPVYIGKMNDSIQPYYKTAKVGYRVEDWNKYRSPEVDDLEIYIDTSQTIGFPMGVWEYEQEPERRVNKKSYPIFIRNQSNDTLSIGFGEILPIVTEAQDSLGNWMQIESPLMYDCGTGLTQFYLPPNEIAISTLRQNKGTNNTKFRVKFSFGDHQIYSNEIEGKMND